jgi:hypothetical protein
LNVRILLLSLALATAAVSVMPSAEADTCASTIAEEVVCPPVLLVYCGLYVVAERQPVVNCLP